MKKTTGWRRDPSGLHEWRYFIDGQPTAQVGDGGLVYTDELPAGPVPAKSPDSTPPSGGEGHGSTTGDKLPKAEPASPAAFPTGSSRMEHRSPAGLVTEDCVSVHRFRKKAPGLLLIAIVFALVFINSVLFRSPHDESIRNRLIAFGIALFIGLVGVALILAFNFARRGGGATPSTYWTGPAVFDEADLVRLFPNTFCKQMSSFLRQGFQRGRLELRSDGIAWAVKSGAASARQARSFLLPWNIVHSADVSRKPFGRGALTLSLGSESETLYGEFLGSHEEMLEALGRSPLGVNPS